MGRPPAGPCAHEGCDKQARSRKLCDPHYRTAKEAGLFGDTSPCLTDGCGRTKSTRGYCRRCYEKHRALGTFGQATCVEVGCDRAATARSRCNKHYEFARLHGAYGPPPACSVPNCDRVARRGDRTVLECSGHYQARRRLERLRECEVASCVAKAQVAGLCNSHYQRKRTHGLSLEELERLDTGVPCEICGERATAVDHCHTVEVVRGYLCNHCNTALGLMRDQPELLTRAADYLLRFREREGL